MSGWLLAPAVVEGCAPHSAARTFGPKPCWPRATTTTFSASLSMICSVLSPNTLNMTGSRPSSAFGLSLAFTLLMPPLTVVNCTVQLWYSRGL